MNINDLADLSIRPALSSDKEAIQVILETYFLDIDCVPIEDFVVAEVGDKIVGAAVLVQNDHCEVHSIAVHPTYRGMGIGSKMFSYLRNSTSYDRIYVRTTSPVFFKRLGFVELPMSKKLELWQDCRECSKFDNCRQYVLCMELNEV